MIGTLLALVLESFEPACVQALARFEESPPRGAACLAVEWSEERGWIPTGEPSLTLDGLEPHRWGAPSRACDLADRYLEHEGVETFSCMADEGNLRS